jgi:chromosome segregation ATPase
MSEKQVIVTLEDGFGRVQTKINTELSAPQLMDKIMEIEEQQSTIIGLQEIMSGLKDDKNQLHKVISKLRQEVAELQTRNAVLSSMLNQIPKNIKEVWLDE